MAAILDVEISGVARAPFAVRLLGLVTNAIVFCQDAHHLASEMRALSQEAVEHSRGLYFGGRVPRALRP